MTAPSHKALLEARDGLIEAMYGDDNATGAEFTEICSSHSDYMWDIQIETPWAVIFRSPDLVGGRPHGGLLHH